VPVTKFAHAWIPAAIETGKFRNIGTSAGCFGFRFAFSVHNNTSFPHYKSNPNISKFKARFAQNTEDNPKIFAIDILSRLKG
jgi:hypothetical protein